MNTLASKNCAVGPDLVDAFPGVLLIVSGHSIWPVQMCEGSYMFPKPISHIFVMRIAIVEHKDRNVKFPG